MGVRLCEACRRALVAEMRAEPCARLARGLVRRVRDLPQHDRHRRP